tara:strand:+ start:149 stop:361 length:213 start_codon:yes stop_codon:yes gene_type:complete
MEELNELVGNPTALLLERFFWLGLGGFLGLAIINSLIRGLNEGKRNTKSVSSEELKNLAKKAIKKNSNNK